MSKRPAAQARQRCRLHISLILRQFDIREEQGAPNCRNTERAFDELGGGKRTHSDQESGPTSYGLIQALREKQAQRRKGGAPHLQRIFTWLWQRPNGTHGPRDQFCQLSARSGSASAQLPVTANRQRYARSLGGRGGFCASLAGRLRAILGRQCATRTEQNRRHHICKQPML